MLILRIALLRSLSSCETFIFTYFIIALYFNEEFALHYCVRILKTYVVTYSHTYVRMYDKLWFFGPLVAFCLSHGDQN